jgi:hypothetical protein
VRGSLPRSLYASKRTSYPARTEVTIDLRRVTTVSRSVPECAVPISTEFVHGLHVRVVTEDGELARELTLDPSRDYQPHGTR